MSTASAVPPTRGLEGDEAFATLRDYGRVHLLVDTFDRFRAADGFSHARALAFQVVLTLVPALIAVVGLGAVLDLDALDELIQRTVSRLAPGDASDLVGQALEQGEEEGEDALLAGLLAAVLAGTTTMGQLERATNRIYGVERDRPPLRKYGLAAALACTAGLVLGVALLTVTAGAQVGQVLGITEDARPYWAVVRWPLGLGLLAGGIALVLEVSPRRRQPEASWLLVGAALAIVLWLALTGVLAVFLSSVSDFGATYGSLAGFMGVLAWALATSIALLLGVAFNAQLEAVRAGVPSTRRTAELGHADDATLPSHRGADAPVHVD